MFDYVKKILVDKFQKTCMQFQNVCEFKKDSRICKKVHEFRKCSQLQNYGEHFGSASPHIHIVSATLENSKK